MRLRVVTWVLTTAIVAVAAFGSAIKLYRFSKNRKHPCPYTAISIIGITALITGLQFIFPQVLANFRLNPQAIKSGEWWRLVTPLFVHSFGWWDACINGTAAVIYCPLAERFYGKRLLALYFIPGILGEIFAFLWAQNGAGASLGIAGVEGSLFALAFFYRSELATSTRIFAILGIGSTVAMLLNQDAHGVSILSGFLLASMTKILCPNQQGGARRQPFGPETNRTAATTASRRLP